MPMTPYSMQWFCGLLCIDFLNVCSFKSLFFFQTPGGAKKPGPGSAATATATGPPLPVCRPAYNLESDMDDDIVFRDSSENSSGGED